LPAVGSCGIDAGKTLVGAMSADLDLVNFELSATGQNLVEYFG